MKEGKIIMRISPKTIYDEIAELGFLRDYLERFFRERFKKDKPFRERMVDTFYLNSKQPVEEVDRYCLEMICDTLGYFLEYNRIWINRKP